MNGREEIKFKIDNGSPITLISLNQIKKYFGILKLSNTNKQIFSYCGKQIKIFGYAVVDIVLEES